MALDLPWAAVPAEVADLLRPALPEVVDEIVYQPLMILVTIPLVVLAILAHVAIAILAPSEAGVSDERPTRSRRYAEEVVGVLREPEPLDSFTACDARREIRDCALFIPIISANTASRHEGYFRLEWDLADQRTHMMARNRVFIVPVSPDAMDPLREEPRFQAIERELSFPN